MINEKQYELEPNVTVNGQPVPDDYILKDKDVVMVNEIKPLKNSLFILGWKKYWI